MNLNYVLRTEPHGTHEGPQVGCAVQRQQQDLLDKHMLVPNNVDGISVKDRFRPVQRMCRFDIPTMGLTGEMGLVQAHEFRFSYALTWRRCDGNIAQARPLLLRRL